MRDTFLDWRQVQSILLWVPQGGRSPHSLRIPSSPATSAAVKQEPDLTSILDSFTKVIQAALVPLMQANTQAAAAAPSAPRPYVPNGFCHYCGDAGCAIATCKHVEQDIRDGKCMRNNEGKVVLPSGLYVPRTIQGRTMRDRIYEWHRQNRAGSSSAPTTSLFYGIQSTAPTAAFTLKADDRIAVLERELYVLRNGKERAPPVPAPPRRILQRNSPPEASTSSESQQENAPAPVEPTITKPVDAPNSAPQPPQTHPFASRSRRYIRSASRTHLRHAS